MSCYGGMFIRDLSGEPVEVPCGQCIGCRLEKARQWAVRCIHEAQMHDENSFITLTYSPEHLPQGATLVKKHYQNFMKRLRNHFKPKEIKFYACGEYGDLHGRPHYHACLFGVDFHDKEILRGSNLRWTKNHFQKGDIHTLYRSPTLEKLWPFGWSTIGEVTFESAGYVARYVMKKITGEMADDHYNGKTPEFALMSMRPGLGKSWYDKYKTDVYPKDFFTINGVKNKPPRYYDSLLERENPALYDALKVKRREKVKEVDSKRKFQKAKFRKLTTKKLIRSYENEQT